MKAPIIAPSMPPTPPGSGSRLTSLLAKAAAGGKVGRAEASDTLAAMATSPQVKVLTEHMGQTAASVADFASDAKDKAAKIELITTIPASMGILAGLALLSAGVMASTRPPPPAPCDEVRAASGELRLMFPSQVSRSAT